MAPNKSIPEPWLSFLRELDPAVETEVRLDCMGGFVVTMVYGFSRPTADLDVLKIAPRDGEKAMLALGGRGGRLHKKYKIYLDPVGVAHASAIFLLARRINRFVPTGSRRNDHSAAS